MKTVYNTSETLIVSLDIGKNVHCLGCYDGQLTEIVAPYELRSDLAGFTQFQALVDPLLHSGRYRQALFGNEPTGVYHEPWAWQIQATYLEAPPVPDCPVSYHWLNPLLSKRRRQQQSIRRRSTDARAVLAIAACLAEGLGYPAYFPDPRTAHLVELVRTWHQQQRRLRHLGRQLSPQIDQLWPGAVANVAKFRRVHPELTPPLPIVQTDALNRARVAAFLLHAPDPYTVLAWTEAELIAFLRQHVGRGGSKTAQRILTMLHRAPLPPRSLAALFATRLQADYATYHNLSTRCAETETAIATFVPQTDAAFLDSVPGISPLLAARYCAAIGSISRFPSAAHVWAFAGFDLVVDDSGDRRRVGTITKRGAPTFRDTLFLIGYHTAQHCAPIGNTFLDAQQRGLAFPLATIHAAHKANRLCYALLRERRGYRPVAPASQLTFAHRLTTKATRRRPHAPHT